MHSREKKALALNLLLSLLMAAGYMLLFAYNNTPLGAAIHYRNPATKPKPTKYNRQEVEAWNAAHKAFELGKGRSSHGSEEGSDAAMRDVFAALKRATR